MALTPEEIAAKEFGLGLRGYDQHEVRVFLRLIAVQQGLAVAGDGELDVSGDTNARSTGEPMPSTLTAASSAPIDGSGDAAIVLDRAHADADRLLREAAAEAEAIRADATAVLTAAQDEALRLVADTYARIDQRTAAHNGSANGSGSSPTVDELGDQIRTLIEVRDATIEEVSELRRRLDKALVDADEGAYNPARRPIRR